MIIIFIIITQDDQTGANCFDHSRHQFLSRLFELIKDLKFTQSNVDVKSEHQTIRINRCRIHDSNACFNWNE